MTCHTCQQGVEVIVDNLYGRRSFRCGCGVISRREPPPPEVKTRHQVGSSLHIGYVKDKLWHGVCAGCHKPFTSRFPKRTCGGRSTDCYKKAKREAERIITVTCSDCPATFTTREARPRTQCLKCKKKREWQSTLAKRAS